MDLCYHLCSSSQIDGRLPGLANLTLDNTPQFFSKIFFFFFFFVSVLLISTINLQHYIPLSMTLTFEEWEEGRGGGGVTRSSQSRAWRQFYHTLSCWSEWNLILFWSSSSSTVWMRFWFRFSESRQICVVLLTALEGERRGTFKFAFIWTSMNLTWFKVDDRCCWTVCFDFSLWLWPWLKVTGLWEN